MSFLLNCFLYVCAYVLTVSGTSGTHSHFVRVGTNEMAYHLGGTNRYAGSSRWYALGSGMDLRELRWVTWPWWFYVVCDIAPCGGTGHGVASHRARN